jgi:TolB-like protein/Flp pilus assembly protein TadD
MFTDMVGFTALTQSDEAQSLEVLERHNRLLRPFFPRFRGREIKVIGDSFLVEFDSALDATNCAVEIQGFLHDYNVSTSEEWKITLRIGVHLGDVVHKDGDVFGDAVNIASRLQPLADPEGVCISEQVFDQVRNKTRQNLVKLEPHDLKGIRFPVDVYKVVMPWEKDSHPPVQAEKNRIAVLPFANMSPDPSDEYFADGVTDEIISTVAGISGLSVISRTSVMSYKGTTKKIEEIGRELKVGSILEGSFKKAGNRIRVTAQLIEVAGDRHLWAQNYDRELNDVFEVQSDVAKQVAEALRVKILSPEMERVGRKPTESTTAYTLYLKGRYLWNKRDVESLRAAAELFERSTEDDPHFALGYVGQADCCHILWQTWGIELEANQDRARRLAAKALELDPDLAEAHATNGLVLNFDYKFRQAEEEFVKAISLKPSYATAHQWYMWVLANQLRLDEARREIEKAAELDPLSPIINLNLGFLHMWERDFEGALEPVRRAAELGLVAAHNTLGYIYGKMGRLDDMNREVATFVDMVRPTMPRARLYSAANIAYLTDDKQTLRNLIPELEAHWDDVGGGAYGIAWCYFVLGDRDKGFAWLERAYSRKEDFLNFRLDPVFDGVRTDQRYLELLRRLGLS